MIKLTAVSTFLLGFYIFHIQQEYFFYKEMKKACVKSKGNCNKCYCWSCPRKEQVYIRYKKLKKYKRRLNDERK